MVTDERVSLLETTLARFMDQTSLILAAIREEVAEIRASNARTDRQLLAIQQQAEKDRQQSEKERREFSERNEQERKEFNERYEKDRKDFNKHMAEISDSMGTLLEDMVAPCGFQIARAIFSSEEAETCAIRVKRKHPTTPGEMMEIDLLATGPTQVLVVEVKRRMDAARASEFRQKLARLPEFFPELSGKRFSAAVASVYLEPSVIAFLNREKLSGIAMGDEVMEVVNLGQF
jgi:hypothetical protein